MILLTLFRAIYIQILILIFFIGHSYAQCAMCKAAAQQASNPESGNYNAGILYLMAFPYILFGILGYVWYWQSRKNRDKKEALESQIKKHLPTYSSN